MCRHNLGETGNLPLYLFLLGEHYLARIQIHHDPAAGRDEGSRVVQVEVLRHTTQVLIITGIVHRIKEILSALVLVLDELARVLPPFQSVETAGVREAASATRVIAWVTPTYIISCKCRLLRIIHWFVPSKINGIARGIGMSKFVL